MDDLTHTFLFHGTGTSSGLPLVPCLTSSPSISSILCRSCREAIDPTVPTGYKNIRGNTGGILRKRGSNGEWLTIVIDVGKTFTAQAIKYFRTHGIKRIDAIVLTHFHSDAINGLDDLRAFTAPPPGFHTDPDDPEGIPARGSAAAKGYTRTPTIPIYLSKETLHGVTTTTPYLVLEGMASGGGDLPSLQWIVFDEGLEDILPSVKQQVNGAEGNQVVVSNENGKGKAKERVDGPEGFWIRGQGAEVWVVPLTVDHGRYFSPPPHLLSSPPFSLEQWNKTVHPFPCNGFVFDGKICYLSDLNYVPKKAWGRLVGAVEDGLEEDGRSSGPNRNAVQNGQQRHFDPELVADVVDLADPIIPPPAHSALPILIIDNLKLTPHPSHLSFHQALNFSSLLKPQRTYLMGMTHPVAHDEWLAACQLVDGTRAKGQEDEFANAAVRRRTLDAHVKGQEVWEKVKRWGGYVRPAYDGLLLGVTKDGTATELDGAGPHTL